MLKAGFCAVDITPPVGSPLAGFAARKGLSDSIHDPLSGRVLVLEGGQAVVLITADLLGLPAELAERVRAAVASRTGLPRANILLCASHTHSGPALEPGIGALGTASTQYRDNLADLLVGAAASAWNSRGPARCGWAVGAVAGIGRNRRHDDGLPIDPAVTVLRVSPEAGGKDIVLFNYSCHPVVLGPDNLAISADYPGQAAGFLEKALGVEAMFVNGAAGDVNTGHSADLSALGYPIPGRTFERAGRLGRKLAAAVISAMQDIELEAETAIAARSNILELATKRLPPLAEAEADLQRREKELRKREAAGAGQDALVKPRVAALYARLLVERIREKGEHGCEKALPVELQAMRIGGCALISAPFELFVEIGLAAKRQSPFPHTFVAGYANGCLGYLPSRAAFEEGGYETVSSRFTAEGADGVEKSMLGLLGELNEEGK